MKLGNALIDDPLELQVAAALDAAGLDYRCGPDGPASLDFYLPGVDVHIEVKRFHSDRIAGQLARAENVIALQGEFAVDWFCWALANRPEAA